MNPLTFWVLSLELPLDYFIVGHLHEEPSEFSVRMVMVYYQDKAGLQISQRCKAQCLAGFRGRLNVLQQTWDKPVSSIHAWQYTRRCSTAKLTWALVPWGFMQVPPFMSARSTEWSPVWLDSASRLPIACQQKASWSFFLHGQHHLKTIE